MSVLIGPVCDAGRCSQVIAGLAAAKVNMVDAQSGQLAAVLTSARDDDELALDARQREVWPSVVQRAISALVGLQSEGRVAA